MVHYALTAQLVERVISVLVEVVIVKVVNMANPTVYASSNDLQKCSVSRLIDEFTDDLMKMSGKCMDIGCGPGDVTTNILLPSLDPNSVIIGKQTNKLLMYNNKLSRVITYRIYHAGTDISQSMIEYANMTYNDEKRLGFEVLDIQTKNLPEKYVSEFDHIFSFYALHWCNNIR